MVFWLIAAALLAVVFYANSHFFNYWKRLGVPQHEAPTFLLGDLTGVIFKNKCVGQAFSDFYNQFKQNKIHGLYFSYRPMLIVTDPLVLQDVLIKDFTSFHDRGLFVDAKTDPIFSNLFFVSGQKWRDMRVKLSPTFTSGKLKVMYPIIRDCAKTLQDYMLKNSENTKRFDIDSRDLFARFSTNVISSVAFGIENDCINDRENVFREMGAKFFKTGLWAKVITTLRFYLPTLMDKFKVKQVEKVIEDFMFSVVKQTVDFREKGGSAAERKDFMQLMIQLKNKGYVSVDRGEEHEVEGGKPTELKKLLLEDVVAQVFVFFIAGFESSSSTMNFCMYELCKNPRIQKKVHDEIDKHLKSGDATDLTYDVLASMKYLDWCVDEALRIYPILPILNREAARDYTFTETNTKIEKGTAVTIPTLGIQRDPDIFDNPMEFRPERFENSSTGNPKAKGICYMPFGDGPRNCIAARMGKLQTKIGLAVILSKFRFEFADQSEMYKEMVFASSQVTLMPKNTLVLRAIPR